MRVARERAEGNFAQVATAVSEVLRAEVFTMLALAERKLERSEMHAREWRNRFARVAKANVWGGPVSIAVIERRIKVVEVVERNDPRMMRAMVDLLRDVQAEIRMEMR